MSPTSPIPLPVLWRDLAKVAVVHAVSAAHFAMTTVQGWCVESRIERVRLAAENARLRSEIAQLKEELRIKDARMERIEPAKRPHHPPHERLAILALKAARGWNVAQTARRLLVSPPTVANWMQRLEEEGESGLVKLPKPVNRFHDLVTDVVQRMRTLFPPIGSQRIADTLARAGLHLSKTTVRRRLKEQPRHQPEPTAENPGGSARTVIANYPGHVWHTDLTAVPTSGGWWVAWLPLAVLPIWPFCWWVGAVIDQYSRRVVATGCWRKQPTAEEVVSMLEAAVQREGAPKYLVSDQGGQFRKEYREWCATHGIKPRYGAVGRYGSIAIIERFWRSIKSEHFRRILVPFSMEGMLEELRVYVEWYNGVRPHQGIFGATPNEVYFGKCPARDGPSFEVRPKWPTQDTELRAEPGTGVELRVQRFRGRAHLPIITLRKAA